MGDESVNSTDVGTVTDENQPLVSGTRTLRRRSFSLTRVPQVVNDHNPLLEQVAGTETLHDGQWTWAQIGGLFFSSVILAVSLSLKILFHCQTVWYWLCVAGAIPFLIILTVYFAVQPPKRSQGAWVSLVLAALAPCKLTGI